MPISVSPKLKLGTPTNFEVLVPMRVQKKSERVPLNMSFKMLVNLHALLLFSRGKIKRETKRRVETQRKTCIFRTVAPRRSRDLAEALQEAGTGMRCRQARSPSSSPAIIP